LHNIFNEFGVPMKLVRWIQMCFNETFSNVLIDVFPVQNGLK